jgi:hypothetical protein
VLDHVAQIVARLPGIVSKVRKVPSPIAGSVSFVFGTTRVLISPDVGVLAASDAAAAFGREDVPID